MPDANRLVSIAIALLLAAGVALRRRRRLHVRIMLTGCAADLGLLVWVEFTRKAVEQALRGVSLLLGVHIAFSVGVLVLYGVQIHCGRRLLRGEEAIRGRHRIGAMLFILFRLGNLVTTLMLPS